LTTSYGQDGDENLPDDNVPSKIFIKEKIIWKCLFISIE
jgi:hypothetical protein